MRTIKIFLASSAELDSDNEQVELFVSRKNKDYNKKRLFLDLSTWKDFISAMTEVHTQEKYNQYIRSCDIAIFLFHTKLGRFTKEEFDTAHQAFLQSSGSIKKPLIYTFFKNDYNESTEILDLKNYIDGLEHFFDTYNSIDDLFVKINRQLDKLENERVIKPDPIDVPVIIKYVVYFFLLPLLVMGGAAISYYYFQTASLTVRVFEIPTHSVPGMPLKEAKVILEYGDKIEIKEFNQKEGFAPFTQIPAKYKGDSVKLKFSAKEFIPIDTSIMLGRFQNSLIILPVKRDNSLGVIFGSIVDNKGIPIRDVSISVKDINTQTDENGLFRIEIPYVKQNEEQRLRAYKKGYQTIEITGAPSNIHEWRLILTRSN